METVDTHTPPSAPTKATFSSGATSSSERPRYDLIPLVALRRLAERFGYGARKHGDHNYKRGFNDTAFVRDRVNHMIEHAIKYAQGDRSTDHLGAVMCNAAMLAEMERMQEELTHATLASGAALDPKYGVFEPPRPPHGPDEHFDPNLKERARCRAEWQGWTCTRAQGHSGDHVAHLTRGEICARWSANQETRQ